MKDNTFILDVMDLHLKMVNKAENYIYISHVFTHLMSHSNWSFSSEQPKSVVQAWPMVNL